MTLQTNVAHSNAIRYNQYVWSTETLYQMPVAYEWPQDFNHDPNVSFIFNNKEAVDATTANEEYDVYFNVSIKTNKKGKLTKTTIGKTLLFNKEGDLGDKSKGVTYTYDGKLANGAIKNLTVSVGTADYQLHVKEIANQVASWLASDKNTTGLKSADAVLASGSACVNELKAIYQGTTAGTYDVFTGNQYNP